MSRAQTSPPEPAPTPGAQTSPPEPAPTPRAQASAPDEAREHYRLGHTAFRQRNWAVAIDHFDVLVGEGFFDPFALFYRGIAYLRAGMLQEAEADLESVATRAPRTLRVRGSLTLSLSGGLGGRAQLALAEVRFQQGSPAKAAATLREFLSRPDLYPLDLLALNRSTDRMQMARAWWLLGRAMESIDRPASRHAFTVVGWGYRDVSFAADARAKIVPRVAGRVVPQLPSLPPEAEFAWGLRLYATGKTHSGELALDRAVRAGLQGPAAAQAWYVLGRHRLNYSGTKAAEAMARAAELTNDASPRYWEGRGWLRARKIDTAVRVAQTLRTIDPRRASRLYVDIASLSEARGRWEEAEQFLRRAAEIAPNFSEGAEAGWRRGWVAWRSGKRTLARQLWLDAGSASSGHGYAAASLFWAARLTPDPGAARALYTRVAREAPWTFHGEMARRRLALEPQKPPAPPHLPTPPADRFLTLPEELAVLGFNEDAVEAAARVGDLIVLSRSLRLLGLPRDAIRAAEEGLDEETLLLYEAYPRHHIAAVEKAASVTGVDQHLIYAVIREESRFDPRAMSTAGAVGLMQLIPSTARMVAGRRVSIEQLMQPELNIRLGAAYLGAQLERFGGSELLAAAAYNAGPGRAARMRRHLPLHDTELAIQRITLRETRYYVEHVLESEAIYRYLAPAR